MLGVGVGLLAAPQAGTETRRALRKRLDAARDGLEDELEGLEQRSRPMRKAVRARAEELRQRGRKRYEEALERLEEIDEDDAEDEGGGFGTALIVGAGIAAMAYFLTSDRTATAREKVREAAATVRDEAEERWERFQSRRGNGHPFADRGTRADPAGSAPPSS
jgi:gas vesicle protein